MSHVSDENGSACGHTNALLIERSELRGVCGGWPRGLLNDPYSDSEVARACCEARGRTVGACTSLLTMRACQW